MQVKNLSGLNFWVCEGIKSSNWGCKFLNFTLYAKNVISQKVQIYLMKDRTH